MPDAPALQSLNHITLAVSDLQSSCSFYTEVLGFKARARWAQGVYLELSGLWLCLSSDVAKPAQDYTHIAFTIEPGDMAQWQHWLHKARATKWKKNSSEGDSVYFLDPDGHKLEIHAGDLASRLASIRLKPYEKQVLYD